MAWVSWVAVRWDGVVWTTALSSTYLTPSTLTTTSAVCAPSSVVTIFSVERNGSTATPKVSATRSRKALCLLTLTPPPNILRCSYPTCRRVCRLWPPCPSTTTTTKLATVLLVRGHRFIVRTRPPAVSHTPVRDRDNAEVIPNDKKEKQVAGIVSEKRNNHTHTHPRKHTHTCTQTQWRSAY